MIPKIIHYCWFGGNKLDDNAQKCIASWKRFFPEYKIIEWNESNFDISKYDFCRKAYEAKKWAFVSDVARLSILYENGGIYFDTDVEIIRSYDDIITNDSKGFIGFEQTGQVASGLGFGAEKSHPLLKELLTLYEKLDFDAFAFDLSKVACTIITTNLLLTKGLCYSNTKQHICDFDIYPTDYFSPIDYYTGRMKKTNNTHSIHWYSASWLGETEKANHKMLSRLCRIFGNKLGDQIYGVISCVQHEGIRNYIVRRVKKYARKNHNEI